MSRFSLDASELPTLGRKGLFDSGIGFSHTFRIVREKIRYVFIMEIEKVPPDLTEQQILNCLEKNLAEANPSLGEKLERGQINRTKILFAQPETYVLYKEVMLARGASVAQLKPVTVIGNDFQKNYFFTLTDTFKETRDGSPSPQQGKEPEKRSLSRARSRRNVPSAGQGAGDTSLQQGKEPEKRPLSKARSRRNVPLYLRLLDGKEDKWET